MSAQTGPPLLIWFSSLFEGRASALFVILAGIGITFLTKKSLSTTDKSLITKDRKSLLKRGILLIVIGLAYTPIWEADILHFYGFYFLLAALVFTSGDKKLLWTAVTLSLAFPLLMLLFDYQHGWDWSSLTYQNFWSVDGMIRHIFFNGFHPVFPWSAFLIFGMWLARKDLSKRLVRVRVLKLCALVWVITESSLYALRIVLLDDSSSLLTSEEINFLFSTSIIPPLPQYILSAGSSATIVLILSLQLSDKFSDSNIIHWLQQTGKMSLTLYVAHVIIGMGVLEMVGILDNQSIAASLLCSFIFCVFSIFTSVFLLRYFKSGPLEWLFRKLVN